MSLCQLSLARLFLLVGPFGAGGVADLLELSVLLALMILK